MKKQIIYIGLLLAAFAGNTQAQDSPSRHVRISEVKVIPTRDSLRVKMHMDFTELELPANRAIVFFPILETPAGKHNLPCVRVMGKRQHIYYLRNFGEGTPDTLLIRRKNGRKQKLPYQAALPISGRPEWTRLYMHEDSCGCNRQILASRDYLLNERDYRVEPYIPIPAYISPMAETRKTRQETGRAFIDFPVNITAIHPNYRDNRNELAKIDQTIRKIKEDPDITITGISLKGHASPEGPYNNNLRLAKSRTQTLITYLQQLHNIDPALFHLAYEAEDWNGLRDYIAATGWTEREALLKLINSDIAPDAKEHTLRTTYPTAYLRLVKECFPALRHTDYVVEYTVRGFDLQQARQIIWSEPQKLSLQEMYAVAQTYEIGSNEYNEVFETAVRMFPQDTMANLNAANAALQRRDTITAEKYLQRAGNSPEATLARGILAYIKGDFAKAEQLMRLAQKQGVSHADYNLKGLLRIKKFNEEEQYYK